MAPSLSLTQVNYTAAGLVASPPNRLDGRDLLAFRPLQIATGISGQAAGSAQCTLGGTRCLVVISAEVVQDDEAQSGLIECSVDVDPSVPLSANLSALLLTLQKSLGHALTSSAIRPAQLVILRSASPPHRPTRAWKLTMDVSLQDVSGGNVADTTFAAAYAALADVRLPRTRAIGFDVAGLQGERQTEGQGHQNMDIFDVRGSLSRTRGGLKGAGVKAGADATVEEASDDGKIGVDFEIQDVWDGAVKLEGADSFPIGVTVNVVRICRITVKFAFSFAHPSFRTASRRCPAGRHTDRGGLHSVYTTHPRPLQRTFSPDRRHTNAHRLV